VNNPTKVAAFAATLVAAFAAATGVGTLVGPVGAPGADSTAEPAAHGAGHTGTSGSAGTDRAGLDTGVPGGLMVSQDGYTLDLAQRQLPAARTAPLRFRILGPDGRPVTRYTTAHGKDLHLVAVRRDLTGFQHVHPRLDEAGTWSVPVDLSDAGVYRVFADFTPADREDNLVLGADLSASGPYEPLPLPAPSRTAVMDGYTVTVDGVLEPGEESELTLSVSEGGAPVTELQPYLEAYGHLVALRDRDLAYLHVHPAGTPDDGRTEAGPGITFFTTVPSAGTYRLFLDFRHDASVHTAGFTMTAAAEPSGQQPDPADPASSSPVAPQHSEPEEGHGHGG